MMNSLKNVLGFFGVGNGDHGAAPFPAVENGSNRGRGGGDATEEDFPERKNEDVTSLAGLGPVIELERGGQLAKVATAGSTSKRRKKKKKARRAVDLTDPAAVRKAYQEQVQANEQLRERNERQRVWMAKYWKGLKGVKNTLMEVSATPEDGLSIAYGSVRCGWTAEGVELDDDDRRLLAKVFGEGVVDEQERLWCSVDPEKRWKSCCASRNVSCTMSDAPALARTSSSSSRFATSNR